MRRIISYKKYFSLLFLLFPKFHYYFVIFLSYRSYFLFYLHYYYRFKSNFLMLSFIYRFFITFLKVSILRLGSQGQYRDPDHHVDIRFRCQYCVLSIWISSRFWNIIRWASFLDFFHNCFWGQHNEVSFRWSVYIQEILTRQK